METRLLIEQVHHIRVLLEEVIHSLPAEVPGEASQELQCALASASEAAGILEEGEEEA